MPSSHATRLHSDLWRLIASLLSRHDLAMLCLASSQILAAVRGVLYRRVLLMKHHLATAQFLLSDSSLAHCVLAFHFTLSARDDQAVAEVVEPFCNAAQALPSLQEVYFELGRVPMFEDPAKQQRFLDHFNNRKIPLRQFVYGNKRGTSPLPDYKFSLSGLTSLRWMDIGGGKFFSSILLISKY
jgi:hypothetical protein